LRPSAANFSVIPSFKHISFFERLAFKKRISIFHNYSISVLKDTVLTLSPPWERAGVRGRIPLILKY
jgi:hypothetical protein